MSDKTHCHFCGNTLIKKFTEDRERLFCTQCDTPIYENPVPASCLVTIDEKERLLLVKRSANPKKGHWCLPGGFMELGELPEQAALRELKEETGLTGKISRLLGVTTNTSAQYHTVLMVGYLIKQFSGKPVAGDDASDLAFFSYDEMPEVAFKSHKNFIRMYYAAYSLQ